MKKKIAVLCAILLFGNLCVSCDSEGGTDRNPETVSGYTFTLSGVDITPHAKMEPIVSALGEPTKYFESESCAFQGMDKVYTYGSVVISTYPKDGVDYVYTVELKDDTITTAEGIYIGGSIDEVKSQYGVPTKDTGTALIFKKDATELSIGYQDGVVRSIVYFAVVEK